MGEDVARACGFDPTVVGSIRPGQTTRRGHAAGRAGDAASWRSTCCSLPAATARRATSTRPWARTWSCSGIPAGVKIHSAVYATTPARQASWRCSICRARPTGVREAEVMDIDEEAFRQGSLSARLYGYLRVPVRAGPGAEPEGAQQRRGSRPWQPSPSTSWRAWSRACLYILGPGTTIRAIAAELGVSKTLLGVDVVLDRELVAGRRQRGTAPGAAGRATGQDRRHADRRAGVPLWPGEPADQPAGDRRGGAGEHHRREHPGQAARPGPAAAPGGHRRSGGGRDARVATCW